MLALGEAELRVIEHFSVLEWSRYTYLTLAEPFKCQFPISESRRGHQL